MDGSLQGKPGPAAIGSVLHDSNGFVLCIFSCPIGVEDSNTAAFLAITKALSLLVSRPEVCPPVSGILLESDSLVVISWASSHDNLPSNLASVSNCNSNSSIFSFH